MEFIVKLDEPRCIMQYELSDENFFESDFQTFVDCIADIQFIDGRPPERIVNEILELMFNFLCLEEKRLEEEIADEEIDQWIEDQI